MQAVEALTLLIRAADLLSTPTGFTIPLDNTNAEPVPDIPSSAQVELKVAVAVAQAMLNTALPVARFRAFVRYESGKEDGREFTICGINIEDIVAALYPMTQMNRAVYVTLWEQRATGADMLEGFQGRTKQITDQPKMFRSYLDSLRKYSVSSLAN
jgi:hypothetical protein